MQKILFIDRDGTLIWEPPDNFQIDRFEKLTFIPGVITWLGKIAREMNYQLVMVTNQDGLGTKAFPEESFWPVHRFMTETLKNEGIVFTAECIDRSFEHENKSTRKPNTGMLTSYLQGNYDLKNSFVIGDRITDVKLAINLGAKAILLENYDSPKGWEKEISLVAKNWKEIYLFLSKHERNSIHIRKTNETQIEVTIHLNGFGNANIETGIGFFNHMLEQIAKHANIDLQINAIGDLHIDEHHTIEDIGIALGEAFAIALGKKIGIERYGFCLPMDDCLAQVAIDFGGRACLVWNAEFKREKIGEMPTEMFSHFFKSFCDGAKCNVNIKAEGNNEHHKIEAIFKAFAKAIKMATTKHEHNFNLPSTKGVL
ncbi:imidazoleglycerol-phosphate dehydratase / histidinol-phosphatase [Flavobacteriales bacterium]|nr:Histidine biosynthesis bifunctional protein HisB [Flavobacteriales bacterium]MCL4815360.1 bifunctional histidinol-phosphatase/imidazoleglycerol-phosphate dehydratase HisB [Flavobacteriales bacterium]WKZ74979.1 MAG: bifunctional histidinol-phosphatase/imidazoleglycerol-phosphate dehydratase HisB [Vicingaceae bacterium]GIK69921.1 MAG: histidine biosynthesis bifunctional protein HisB [Bacteroidota bacterium]CAG0960416.1 imidazoleglycerol-phosphate dehydratase / histidinol-phosphatase [Flavobact